MNKSVLRIFIIIVLFGGAGSYYYFGFLKNDLGENINILYKGDMIDVISDNNDYKLAITGVELSELDKIIKSYDDRFASKFKNKTHDYLINNEDFKKYVEDMHNTIQEYKEKGKDDIVNYLYDSVIGGIVVRNRGDRDDYTMEIIAQSCKKKEFKSISEKEKLTELMKQYVDIRYYEPIMKTIDNIDRSRLDNDRSYFGEIMLNPENSIFYMIFKNRYEWNKAGVGFKTRYIEGIMVNFLCDRFESILSKLGYDKKWFEKKSLEYYDVKDLEEFGKMITKEYKDIMSRYDLVNKGVPANRFFRAEEEKYYTSMDGINSLYSKISNLDQFKKDVKDLRLKLYVLSYLGKDQDMFDVFVRGKFLEQSQQGGFQNIYRVSWYVDEVMKIPLDNMDLYKENVKN